jgi:hypothetical protein
VVETYVFVQLFLGTSSEGLYLLGFNPVLKYAGTPRVSLIRETFNGNGNWTATVTINNNGTAGTFNDSGTYTVNADCTGRIFNTASGIIVHLVIVDGGKEIYRLLFPPGPALVAYGVAKKQFPDDNGQD